MNAAELPGMSERSFRRYRHRFEEEGLEGLFDRRLAKIRGRGRAPDLYPETDAPGRKKGST